MSSSSKSSKSVRVQQSLLTLTNTDITTSSSVTYDAGQTASPRSDTVIAVNEKHLSKGTASSNSELTQIVPLPSGSVVDTTGWAKTGSFYTMVTQDGILRYNGRSLTFTLRTSVAHDTEETNQTLDLNYQIRLTYEEKPAENFGFIVKVTDDIPVVSLNAFEAAVSPGSTSYSAWAVNYGADGAATSDGLQICFNGGEYTSVKLNTPVAVVINGVNYGDVIFYPTGAYAFKASPAASSTTLTLGLKATDGDGDVVTNSTTITIDSPLLPAPPIGSGTEIINEANLSNGTAPNAEALTKAFAVPEGYTVNTAGWNNQGGVYTFAVNNGTLTYNVAANTIAFTLTSSLTHTGAANQQNHTVSVPLKNTQGAEVTSALTVKIEDDMPTVSVNGSETNPGGSCQGSWSANYGADGAAATQALQVKFGNGTYQNVVVETPFAVVINGTNLGSIVFHNNDQYSFTANAAAPNTNFEMALRATDRDGDPTIKTANIAIAGSVEPVEPPAFIGGPSVILDEANLATGSAPNEAALTANFTVPAGFTVDTEGWLPLGEGNYSTSAPDATGFLVYSQATNTLSFTLNASTAHAAGSDSAPYSMDVTLLDTNQKAYTVPVVFTIADDSPVVSFTADAAEVAVDDTVFGTWNIHYGADKAADTDAMMVSFDDGATFQPVLIGTAMDVIKNGQSFGTITFKGDGTYSFKASAEGTLSISLQGQDTDGDTTSASFTLGITGGTGPIPGTVTITVDEMNLQNGTEHNAELLTKVIALPENSTVDVAVGSWTQNGSIWTLTTTNGSLVYDQAANYLSYTLVSNATHGTGATDDSIKEEISIGLLDEGATQVPFTVIVNILDDAAVVLLNQTGSGSIASGESVSGTWDAAFGADGKESLQLSINNGTNTQTFHVVSGETNAVIINGVNYGDLVFSDSEKTYTFVSKEGAKGTLTLTLIATDTDGDVTSSEPATITITTVTPPLPGLDDVYLSFDEANLSNGSAPDYDALVRVICLPEGYTVDTAGWVKNGSMYSLAVNSGVFRYNGRSLTFTLRTSSDHDINLHDEEITKDYTLTLKSADENTHSFNVVLTIQDDAPSLYFGHTTGQVTAGSSTNGMWVASFGADGKAANGMQVSFDGGKTYYDATVGTGIAVLIDDVNYGRITFNASGTYTFKANPAIPNGDITLTLKIADGDGDIAKQDVTLTVSGGVAPAPGFGDITINEANLDAGTDPNTVACTQIIPVPAGYKVSTLGWVKTGDNLVNLVAGGALIYNPATNTLVYSLYSTIEHGQGIFDDSFSVTKSITLVAPNGGFTSAPITITIVDDAPVVSFANSSSWNVNFGADGVAGSNSLSVSFDNGKTYVAFTPGEAVEIVVGGTVYGTVTFNTDNTCVFTAAPGKAGSALDVTLKATDADGDSTTQNLSVTLPGGETPDPVDLGAIAFEEQYLAAGTSPDADALVKVVTLPEGTTVNTAGWAQDGTVWSMTSGHYSLNYDSTANTLTVTMVSATTHPDAGNDVATEAITVALLVDGKETTGNLSIAVTDDAPIVTFGIDEPSVEAGKTLGGTWNAVAGADGEAGPDYLQISFDNGATYTQVTVGTSHTVINNGVTYGFIEFTQDGTYSFISTDEARGTVTLTLKATDGDGDSVTQTLSLTVTEPGVVPVDPVDLGAIAFEEQYLAAGTSPDADALVKVVTLPEGTTVNTAGWAQDGTVWSMTSGHYSLNYDSTANTLTVTMVSATTHPDAGNDVATEAITVALLVDGKETTGNLSIAVTDDAPIVTFGIDEPSVEAGKTLGGTWNAVAGADGEAGPDYLQISFDNGATYTQVTVGTSHTVINNGVTYGFIEFTQDGTYSFISTDEARGTVTLTLKATDGDGDSTTQTLSLTVTEPGVDPVDPVDLGAIAFEEQYLAAGTSPDADALVKVVTLPEGTTVNTAGWAQDGTVWSMTSGHYSLNYDSTANTLTVTMVSATTHPDAGNDVATEAITVALLVDGKETTGNLSIAVTDDAPIVTFGIDEPSVEAGKTLGGTWNAVAGADGEAGPDYLQISFDNGATYTQVTVGTSHTVINNGVTYGFIEFTQDGTYSFISTDEARGTVTLTLKATDGDGDSTTQTLSLTVTEPGVDPVGPVEIGTVTFDEKHIENGTDFNQSETTKTTDLPANVTIDTTGWAQSGDTWSFTSPDNTYSFIYNTTLNQLSVSLVNTVAHTGEGRDTANAVIPFPILVDGKATTGNLTVSVIDDAPVGTITASDTPIATGESFIGTLDVNFGADGKAVTDSLQVSFDGGSMYQTIVLNEETPVVFNGTTYGTIIFKADNTYEFISTFDADGSVSIVIKATDGDGDTWIDERNIYFTGSVPSKGDLGTITLDEKHTETGTDYDGDQTIQTISLPAGTVLDTSSESWVGYDGGIWELITRYYSYQYNSNTNELSVWLFSGLVHPGEGRDTITTVIPFPILVDGVAATGNLTITVIDDAPVITFGDEDTTIKSGETLTGTWEHSFGSDGFAEFGAVQISFDNGLTYQDMPLNQDFSLVHEGTTYGTLLLGPNNGYSFKSAEGVSGNLDLTIKLTDDDGDSTTQKLPIVITSTTDPLPITLEPVTLDESNLEQGTAADPDALTKVITLPADYTVDTTATGWTETAGVWSATFEAYRLDYNPDTRVLSITLTNTLKHTLENRDSIIQNLTIPLHDKDGVSVHGALEVTVQDDIPVIQVTQSAEEVEAGASLTGTYEINYGADGKAEGDVLQVSFDGGNTYTNIVFGTAMPILVGELSCGSIIFTEDGNYTFTSEQNIKGQLSIILKGSDSEGDAGTQAIQVVITEPNEPGSVTLTPVSLDESNLEQGTAADPDALTKVITLPADYTVDTTATGWTETAGVWSATFEAYRLDYNPDTRVLSITLTNTLEHTLENRDSIIQNLTIPLHDKDGVSVHGALEVTVQDDIPVIQVTQSAEEVEAGASLTGTYEINYGADGKAEGDVLQVSFDGGNTYTNIVFGTAMPILVGELSCGSIIFTEDGNYTFTSEQNIKGQLSIILKGSDSEGDAGTQAIQVVITEPNEPGSVTLTPVSLDESNLEQGTAADPDALTKIITLPADYTVDTTATGWTETAGVWSATFEAYRLDYNPDTRTLSITLTNTLEHTLENRDSIIQNLTIPLHDKDGVSVHGALEVTVQDDIPVASFVPDAEMIAAGETLSGTWSALYGADGPYQSGDGSLLISFDGNKTFLPLEPGPNEVEVWVNGTSYGILLLGGDNTFTFTARPGVEAVIPVSLRIIDSEGVDTATAGFTLTIVDQLPEPGLQLTASVSEQNLPTGTAANAAALEQAINLPDKHTVDTTGWDAGAGKTVTRIVGDYGLLTYNTETNLLTFTLTGPIDHGNTDSLVKNITLTLLDGDNTQQSGALLLTIVDDAPTVQPMFDLNLHTIPGTGEVGGIYYINPRYGADGDGGMKLRCTVSGTTQILDLTPGTAFDAIIDGKNYGTFFFTTEMSYTFKASGEAAGTLSLELLMVDGDGDYSASAPQALTIHKEEYLPLNSIEVLESNLSNGTASGTSYATGRINLPDGYNISTDGWTSSTQNGQTVYTKDVAHGTLSYAKVNSFFFYTLTEAIANAPGDDSFITNISLTLEGAKNPAQQFKAQFTVTIEDDNPLINFSNSGYVEVVSDTAFTSTWAINYGADNQHAQQSMKLDVSANGDDQVTTIDIVLDQYVALMVGNKNYGTIMFESTTGKYHITANKEYEGDSIQLTLKGLDTDGDTGLSAQLNYTIIKGIELPDEPVFGRAALEVPTLDGLLADEASLDNLLAGLPAAPPANDAMALQETTLQPVNTASVFVELQSSAEEDMLRALSNTL